MSQPEQIKEEKIRLRHEALRRRSEIAESAVFRMEAAEAALRLLLDTIPMDENSVIGGYWPIGSEFDLRPTLTYLNHKYKCALPMIDPKTDKLVFCEWHENSSLIQGAFNVMTPETAAQQTPNVILVPVVAFDRRGYRLGYGGGYYDRSLAELSKEHAITTVGIAYASQEIPMVPTEPHDYRLDWMITEEEAIKFITPKQHPEETT